MSRDNWERLAVAAMRKVQLWEMFHDPSSSPSISPTSSDLSNYSDTSWPASPPPTLAYVMEESIDPVRCRKCPNCGALFIAVKDKEKADDLDRLSKRGYQERSLANTSLRSSSTLKSEAISDYVVSRRAKDPSVLNFLFRRIWKRDGENKQEEKKRKIGSCRIFRSMRSSWKRLQK